MLNVDDQISCLGGISGGLGKCCGVNGEGIVQTTNREPFSSVSTMESIRHTGGESRSGKHNPQVVGSSPTSRTVFRYFLFE